MMMAERKFELGMLIAIGMKKHLLSWVINGELLLMTVGGALAGIAISVPLVYYLSVHPITLEGEVARAYTQFGFDPVLPTELNLKIIVIQTCIVSVIALVVSLYPFWHIHKLDPVSAMKK
jgi:ABC-type lipoprotein release transport system permease subunit